MVIKSCSLSQEEDISLFEEEGLIISTASPIQVRTGSSQAKYGPYDLVYFGEEVILDDSYR
jgi:hypothetical protein